MRAKQRAFVEHYIGGCNGVRFNATQAAIAAGYSKRSARNQAYRLMMNDDISAAIQQRLDDLTMNTDEVLVRLTEMARNEGMKFIERDGRINLAGMIADEKVHLIKSVKFDAQGNVQVDFHDALAGIRIESRIDARDGAREHARAEGVDAYVGAVPDL